MKCSACGHSNRAEAKFCEECGAPLSPACGKCGAESRPGAKFCDACGSPLHESRSGKKIFQPSQHRTKHLEDLIRRDHADMEGERRIISVLFADAVGHTAMSEELGEEEMYNLMQGCFARMQESVERYDGTVNQFTGDGVLALFGAPIAHEDSARRAVAAALDMQKCLGEYAAQVKKRHPIQCSYRVGVNTGPVVVGKISDDLDLDFAAVGDTVNLASRMETMAESGTVYISENTFRAVADYFDCKSLGAQKVKGKRKPVTAYKVIREKAFRTRFDAATERGLTAYVGRDHELAFLNGYFNRAKNRNGHVVLVTGEAGIGKSRLLLEFRLSLRDQGATWIEGHCVTYGRSTPYLPIIEIIKNYFAVKEGDTELEIIARMDEHTGAWPYEAQATVPYLKYLLNVDPGDEALAGMDPMERRAGIFDALRALFARQSQEETLVLVIEDLHWIDEKTEEALTTIIDVIVDAPILLVLTSRPGYKNPLGDRSYFSRLALTHLAGDDASSMVKNVLESAQLPEKLLHLIGNKAEGNPFYIEEVTKCLVESGDLLKTNGSYSLECPIDQVVVPDTIHEVILARIDRLDRGARGAMQLASVIGREFTVRLLNRISDIEAELDDLLHELKSLELIYETSYSPELSYMFKHALTHDVAYSTLLVERRRALHHIVAIAIEELYADRLPEHYEALAHHYHEGETWEKALAYLIKAGDKSVGVFANNEASDYYGRALDVCDKLGDPDFETFARIAEKRAWVGFILADYSAAIADINRIVKLAEDNGDLKQKGRALALRGYFETYNHDFESSEATLAEAIAIGEDQSYDDVLYLSRVAWHGTLKVINRHEEAKALESKIITLPTPTTEPFAVGYWHFFASLDENWRGNYDGAAKIARAWRELAPDTPQVMLLHVKWSEALTMAGSGRYGEAIRFLHEIAAECERMGEIAVRARAYNTLGWIHADLYDHSRAMELNHQGIEVALLEGDEPEKVSNASLNWSDSLILLDRLSEAQKHFQEVEQVVRNPKPEDRWMLWRFSQHFFHSYGELALANGELDKAASLADECLTLAEGSDSKKYIVKARRLRGEVLAARSNSDEAEKEFATALEIAKTIGNPPQLWKTYAALGAFYTGQDKAEKARQAYGGAMTVIDNVALALEDESLRKAFLASKDARAIAVAAH